MRASDWRRFAGGDAAGVSGFTEPKDAELNGDSTFGPLRMENAGFSGLFCELTTLLRVCRARSFCYDSRAMDVVRFGVQSRLCQQSKMGLEFPDGQLRPMCRNQSVCPVRNRAARLRMPAARGETTLIPGVSNYAA